MAVLKTSGRADIAAAYKALAAIPNNFMIGFGSGEDWWGSQQQVVRSFVAGAIALPAEHAPITGLAVRSADGETLYQQAVDYAADLATGAITRIVGGALDDDSAVQLTYLPTVPNPDLVAGGLAAETGRVSVSAIHFIVPFAEADPGANFTIVDGVKYALVLEPSRMLLFLGHLPAADGAGAPIREYGIFSRCAVAAGLPPGQTYFEPGEIDDPGTLIIVKRRPPVPHDGTVALDMSIILEL